MIILVFTLHGSVTRLTKIVDDKIFYRRCIGSHEDAKPGGGCSDEDVNLRLTLRQYEVMSGIFSSLLRWVVVVTGLVSELG